MHKLVVFGSARVDAFLEIPEDKAGKICNIDTKECVIELSYADKIPLKDVKFTVAGNGANVAVGVKRLGVDSLLAAELGHGPLADFVMSELKKEIDTTYVSQTEGVNQGFGAVIVYAGERTILSYYSPVDPPFPKDACRAEWAYLTSTGENFEGYYEKVYASLVECKPKLAFNPGKRQIAKGRDWLKKYLEETELILVNRKEAEIIVEMKGTGGREKQLLDSLHNLGPKTVVITDGRNGSFAKQGDKYYRLGILPIDAIERTGAGDSFSAGCLSALIKGKDLSEAMLWGTINSASVTGYFGPEAGLLRDDQLPEWFERAESSGLKVEDL